jgi:hypothetical protein
MKRVPARRLQVGQRNQYRFPPSSRTVSSTDRQLAWLSRSAVGNLNIPILNPKPDTTNKLPPCWPWVDRVPGLLSAMKRSQMPLVCGDMARGSCGQALQKAMHDRTAFHEAVEIRYIGWTRVCRASTFSKPLRRSCAASWPE